MDGHVCVPVTTSHWSVSRLSSVSSVYVRTCHPGTCLSPTEKAAQRARGAPTNSPAPPSSCLLSLRVCANAVPGHANKPLPLPGYLLSLPHDTHPQIMSAAPPLPATSAPFAAGWGDPTLALCQGSRMGGCCLDVSSLLKVHSVSRVAEEVREPLVKCVLAQGQLHSSTLWGGVTGRRDTGVTSFPSTYSVARVPVLIWGVGSAL